ncbi:ScbA/BarX family gamma-butyrolactone biosynthesis protein [Streptomyces sp. Root369]|uniref:ScbA/BarX family gamma-butyrolactone biosynthesis protein n=1 Tax=Streptomyces sp. Root369 TaxID=1736523 RepID=UPI0007C85457|nr:ScbA/BarX family gamma-butyrolactone biosynthesis protein [Streptomyces sp. Root369]
MSESCTLVPAVQTPPRVAQQSVHKLNAAEVLLTGWRRTADDRFAVTARWPPDHDFYAVRHHRHDPLLLSETVRQTFPLLAHEAYGVPFGHHLVWDSYAWCLNSDLLHADGSAVDLELHVAAQDVVRRRGSVAVLSLAYDVVRDGVSLATATSRFTIQVPAVYQRLRGDHGDPAAVQAIPVPPAVSAQSVGKVAVGDVVLAPADAPQRWQLRVDADHSVLFDHPVDHAPGMLLLEAVRQVAHGVSGRTPVSVIAMDVRFHRYAELDAPSWLEARRIPSDAAGRPRLVVTCSQEGAELLSCTVTLDEASQQPEQSVSNLVGD